MVVERHKDKYRAFFTDDKLLCSYMASLLFLKPNDSVLEPASGKGALIEAVLTLEPRVTVEAYEIHQDYVDELKERFAHTSKVSICAEDTLFSANLNLREQFGPKFDKIIANPPYGGWQDYSRRDELKRHYPGFYIKETYSLFLLRCLNLLAGNGKLVFIVPSTFLHLHLHSPLRYYLLRQFQIESIDSFPSSFFPGVSFGYANLCIIALTAKQSPPFHSFRMRYVNELAFLNDPLHLANQSKWILQADVENALDSAFPNLERDSYINVHHHTGLRFSDLAHCVTGFYSGFDKKYLRVSRDNVRGAGKYESVDESCLATMPIRPVEILEGIEGKKVFVPILKGGGHHFVKPSLWFIDWSREAVQNYKTNKKARFQNSSFYFRKGIGFPMVTSSRPTAATIDNSLFDQSIVGIFPKDPNLYYYLLAYCNSTIFWNCLKSLNPTANNSARYILKTPVIIPSPELISVISQKTQNYVTKLKSMEARNETLEREIDEMITWVAEKSKAHET
jgi:adenine-specific DNA-methyltransferase